MTNEHAHLPDDQFFEYLDEALSPDATQEFERMLVECPVCRQRLSEMRHFFGKIESVEAINLERDLAPVVMARISGESSLRILPNLSASLSLQGLATLLILAASLPTLLQQAYVADLAGTVEDNNRLLLDFVQGLLAATQNIGATLSAGLEGVISQTATLPLGSLDLVIILPLLLSTGLLWLVGNGILLRNLTSRRR